jgi:hypothetical protein
MRIDRESRETVLRWAVIGAAGTAMLIAAVVAFWTSSEPSCGDIFRNSFEWNHTCEISR